MSWASVAGLGIGAASMAAFLIMAWRLMASERTAQLEGARLADFLGAERAAHAQTRDALLKAESAYADLHDRYARMLDSSLAALPDDALVAAAGGRIGDGLLEPEARPDGQVDSGPVVPQPPG